MPLGWLVCQRNRKVKWLTLRFFMTSKKQATTYRRNVSKQPPDCG